MRRAFFELSYLLLRPPWDTGIVPPEVEQFAASAIPGRAIDLGCGTGLDSVRLAQLGWKVTGVDFSALAIRQARARARQSRVDVLWIQRSVLDTDDLAGPFDFALDVGCFHSLAPDDRPVYWGHLRRWLPEGASYLVYSFLSPDGGRWPRREDLLDGALPGFVVTADEMGTFRSRPSVWLRFRRTSDQVQAAV
jgi:SAM-dependent methyltransferase